MSAPKARPNTTGSKSSPPSHTKFETLIFIAADEIRFAVLGRAREFKNSAIWGSLAQARGFHLVTRFDKLV